MAGTKNILGRESLLAIKDKLDTKVDKEEGKGLSSNDFTDSEKLKLEGIENGAQVNPEHYLESASVSENTLTIVPNIGEPIVFTGGSIDAYTKEETNALLSNKVDKVSGMGLSHNDFTDSDKLKLDATYISSEVDALIQAETERATGVEESLEDSIEAIKDLIPAQASPSNKLTDKDFVNSSIATNTAYFLGTYNVVTDLGLTIDATHTQVAEALSLIFSESGASIPSNNDYVFVSYPDATIPTQFTKFERYKYNSEELSWAFEYELNNSSFTAEQWAAINSGITAEQIAKFVTTDTEQTISGVKTFSNDIQIGIDKKIKWSNSQYITGNNSIIRFISDAMNIFIGESAGGLIPVQVGTKIPSLGNSTNKWQNLYLSGIISDGTNSVTVADISNGLFNVINANEMTDSTHFTQAQYNLITNGKPTMVNGVLYDIYNPVITSLQNVGGNYYGFAFGWSGTSGTYEGYLVPISIITSQLRTQIDSNPRLTTYIKTINGKTIPAYQSDTTKQYKFVQQIGGTLAYVEDVQGGMSVDDQTAEDYVTLTSTNWSNLKSNHYYTASVSGGTFDQIKFFPDEEESRYNLSIDGNDYNVRLSLNSPSEAKGMFVIKENGHAYEITIFVSMSGIASADIVLRCATIY